MLWLKQSKSRYVHLYARQVHIQSLQMRQRIACNKTEQLAIVGRYVDVEAVKLFEYFWLMLRLLLSMLVVFQNLFLMLYERISWIRNALWVRDMMMHPSRAGVVLDYNKICEVVPHAAYVHCYAHCLNLVLISSHGNRYIFLSRSATHAIFLQR